MRNGVGHPHTAENTARTSDSSPPPSAVRRASPERVGSGERVGPPAPSAAPDSSAPKPHAAGDAPRVCAVPRPEHGPLHPHTAAPSLAFAAAGPPFATLVLSTPHLGYTSVRACACTTFFPGVPPPPLLTVVSYKGKAISWAPVQHRTEPLPGNHSTALCQQSAAQCTAQCYLWCIRMHVSTHCASPIFIYMLRSVCNHSCGGASASVARQSVST